MDLSCKNYMLSLDMSFSWIVLDESCFIIIIFFVLVVVQII